MTKRAGIAAVICCIALFNGCGDNKSPSAAKTPPQKKTGNEPKIKTPSQSAGQSSQSDPDFRLTSNALYADIKRLKSRSVAKYRHKTAEVSGEVIIIDHALLADVVAPYRQFFVLEGGGGFRLGVKCYFREEAPWSRAVPGQVVTLRGRFGEGGEEMLDCRIVRVSGKPTPRFTAEALAKKFDVDAAGTTKELDLQYVYLEGTVSKNDDGARIELKHSGKCTVLCVFSNDIAKKTAQSYQPGQRIKVVGRFTTLYGKDKAALSLCLPIPVDSKQTESGPSRKQ